MSSSLQVKPIVIGTVKFILASFAITYCPLDDIKFGGFLEYIGSQLAKIGKFFQGSNTFHPEILDGKNGIQCT